VGGVVQCKEDLNMKKLVLLIPLIALVLITGCANQQLDRLKEIDQQNRIGLVEAYDDALQRTKVERLDMEDQLIDLQSDYELVIMAYENETGKSFEDISSTAFISLNELAKHKFKVEKAREERRKYILKSYARFYATIDTAKDPKLMKAIEKIEEKRSETKKSFFDSIFDVIKKIIPSGV